jgi:Fe-S-cluster containining protein
VAGKDNGLQWVTENLAVGGAPLSPAHLDWLKSQGVDAILNLCAEFQDLHELESDHGFEVYYLPVEDEEAPELENMERALAWLDEAIYLGKKVFIHCRHGIGRTGTLLNAYLLRRGLGHRLAARKLKELRSKPANFDQWWTIRKYGRQSGKLEIREPSLEFKNILDLRPFFDELEILGEEIDQALAQNKQEKLCGRDHAKCCRTPVNLTLIEAVHLTHKINLELTSRERLTVIDLAVQTSRRERDAQSHIQDMKKANKQEASEHCLYQAGGVCPLLHKDRCRLFAHRPFQCRSHDLDDEIKNTIWSQTLGPELERLTRELFLAVTSAFPPDKLPSFPLPDVVSGRYIQALFHLMMEAQ